MLCYRSCAPLCPACHDATTPNGTVMASLLQCVWSQWDDPVEVCVFVGGWMCVVCCGCGYVCACVHARVYVVDVA